MKELLYVSKTDGKQRTEYKTIDFAELLRVQIADVTDLLSEKEISLSVDIPDKILCDADPAQMERAIQNVLVNAIRYSPNGEAIYISLSNDKNTVSCKVENTGVHIPEEMIPIYLKHFTERIPPVIVILGNRLRTLYRPQNHGTAPRKIWYPKHKQRCGVLA